MNAQIFKFLLLVSSGLAMLGCEEACNNCLEISSKSIKYVDSSGTNLFFGSAAIFNPDSVMVIVGENEIVGTWKQEDKGAIAFQLDQNYGAYRFVLPNAINDTLAFQLAEEKSENCCGNRIYSDKTFLNGERVANDDLIVITR